MEQGKMSDTHLTSAAAFVEGGIQDACEDTCSICLEAFCDNDPSTLTTCKHEYHLQCILEWCQRSSQCPMCWQPISLKDPSSQELLDAVEHERNMRMNPPRNTTIFHHPTLGDFELQHLPVSASESELEERILQHLAAAAAMGRARQLARREGQRSRSSAQGRPHFLVFSTNDNGASPTQAAASVGQRDGNGPPPAVMETGPYPPFITTGEDSAEPMARPSSPQAEHFMASSARSSTGANNQQITSSNNRRSPTQTPPNSQDRAGPSDFQALSDTMKSRFSAFSMRCKESISKNTRGWKDRLFARNSSTPDPRTEVHREIARNSSTPDHSSEVCGEVNQSTAAVTRMMDHLGIAEDGRRIASESSTSEENSTRDPTEPNTMDTDRSPSLIDDTPRASVATSSASG